LKEGVRDELLNEEIFTTLLGAQVLIENLRRNYRFDSILHYGCRPSAPEAKQLVNVETLTLQWCNGVAGHPGHK
jgi:hypothetical protein